MKRPKEERQEKKLGIIFLLTYYIVLGIIEHKSIIFMLSAFGFITILFLLMESYFRQHRIENIWRQLFIGLGICTLLTIFIFQFTFNDNHTCTTEKSIMVSANAN